jgi:phosphatidylserine/phosphatidylglycerophosphate/cardiolipin synthase-like enzyme
MRKFKAHLLFASLLFSVTAHAKLPKLNQAIDEKESYINPKRFRLDKGDFKHSLEDIQEYFKTNTPHVIPTSAPKARKDHYAALGFKVNNRNEIQAQNYYFQDFIELQSLFRTDIQKYMDQYGGSTFLEAKRNFYTGLNFDINNFRHESPYLYMKEWGGLNHTPFHRFESDFSQYDDRLGKPFGEELTNHPIYTEEFQKNIDNITPFELTVGNSLKVYADNASFKKKLEMLNNAKSSFWMSTLAFICDDGGDQFSAALLKKADQGVKIKIIYDKWVTGGTNLYHNNCIKPLRKHKNIEVIKANDFFKHKGLAIYHVKEIIVDKEQVIMGGQNLIDADSLSRGTDFSNRDIDVHITGPMVSDIALNYVNTWEYFRNKSSKNRRKYTSLKYEIPKLEWRKKEERENRVRGKDNYNNWFKDSEFSKTGMCRYTQQSPNQSPSTVAKVMAEYLKTTKEYLAITNPMMYDSLRNIDEKFDHLKILLEIIKDIQERGIKFDLISSAADMSANEFIPVLRERIKTSLSAGNIPLANLRQWEMDFFNKDQASKHIPNLMQDFVPYPNTHVWTHISFNHSKIYYIDRLATFVGSMNLHSNATDQAWESGIYCHDLDFNKQIEEILLMDKLNSIPLIYKNR